MTQLTPNSNILDRGFPSWLHFRRGSAGATYAGMNWKMNHWDGIRALAPRQPSLADVGYCGEPLLDHKSSLRQDLCAIV